MTSISGLFRRFDRSAVTQLAMTRQSEQRQARAELAMQYPALAEYWDDILPRGQDIMIVHAAENVKLVCLLPPEGDARFAQGLPILFFQHFDGWWIPHLVLLHRYPFMMPAHQVDLGGCKYVISGANVMCPGLVSPGGRVAPDLAANRPVAIYIEGKRHAVAVGITTMSSAQILAKGSHGVCVDNAHHLGDGLWLTPILNQTA